MVLEKAKEVDGTLPYWAVIRPVVTEEPGLPPVPAVILLSAGTVQKPSGESGFHH